MVIHKFLPDKYSIGKYIFCEYGVVLLKDITPDNKYVVMLLNYQGNITVDTVFMIT